MSLAKSNKRKIILFIASSLDGYIARENGDVDWLFTDADYGYNKFYRGIDTLLFGRKTLDKILEFGSFPYKGKSAFVFTRSQRKSPDDSYRYVTGDILHFTRRLLNKSGKNIWLVGGGEIIAYLLSQNLIDEIILTIHPVILGSGIPFIPGSIPASRFRLIKKQRYKSGLVQLHYIRTLALNKN